MASMLIHSDDMLYMNNASGCLHTLTKNSSNAAALMKSGGVEIAMRMLYWHSSDVEVRAPTSEGPAVRLHTASSGLAVADGLGALHSRARDRCRRLAPRRCAAL